MYRSPLILMTSLALLVVTALPAWAHAGFVQSSVPADSAQELQLRVPGERTTTYTVRIETLVPADFDVTDCAAPAQFSCAVTDAANGAHVVTWERPSSGGVPVDSGLVYGFDVRTPSSTGVYDFPTVQTYSDGEEAPWIGEQGSDHPAPQLEVTGEGTEAEEDQGGPDTDHGDPTTGSDDAGDETDTDAGDDRGDSSDSSTTDGDSSSGDPQEDDADSEPADGAAADDASDATTSDGDADDEPAAAADTSVTEDGEPTTDDGTAEEATSSGDADIADGLGTAPEPVAADDDGGAWPWFVAGLLAIAAAAAGAVGVQRLRAR